MKNKTLDLIIENYKNQLFQLMQVDYLTIEQRSEANNLIEALTDLTNARVIYERFTEYAAN
jgi:DNA-binding transcriptional regulator PaaX